jgi:hypothetical protein
VGDRFFDLRQGGPDDDIVVLPIQVPSRCLRFPSSFDVPFVAIDKAGLHRGHHTCARGLNDPMPQSEIKRWHQTMKAGTC